MRPDVTGHDVVLLINAAAQAVASLGDAVPGLWRRYLSLIFDGLRPEAARPLPVPAPVTLIPAEIVAGRLRPVRPEVPGVARSRTPPPREAMDSPDRGSRVARPNLILRAAALGGGPASSWKRATR
ncbi:hypothetical protein [Nonomuraea jabiensis]|uniref:hypothetical protein n=1 Tax=Nonomuraea jabiensis TaxID=882448 RepID=UPI0036809B87